MNIRLFFSTIALLISAMTGFGQQLADPEFSTAVANPAYNKNSPRVLFDEAHHNFHTATGRYKPFVDLISNDGYQVSPNKQTFTKDTFEGFQVLVIANALGSSDSEAADASSPAFTQLECDNVRDWVRNGGALLLIADHAPA